MSPSPDGYTAVVPIRSWTTGKSRLDLADADREAVSCAFALDVVGVLLASPAIDQVLVVTSDDDVRAAVDDCTIVDDPGSGLNAAVAAGCAIGAARVVVVPSDLPCLTTDVLSEVLRLAAGHTHAFCPDAEGDGTTLVVSRDPAGLTTSYGPGSAAAHRRAGLTPLLSAPVEARRDVDTLIQLADAEALGVGRRTAAAVADLRAAFPPRR